MAKTGVALSLLRLVCDAVILVLVESWWSDLVKGRCWIVRDEDEVFGGLLVPMLESCKLLGAFVYDCFTILAALALSILL